MLVVKCQLRAINGGSDRSVILIFFSPKTAALHDDLPSSFTGQRFTDCVVIYNLCRIKEFRGMLKFGEWTPTVLLLEY